MGYNEYLQKELLTVLIMFLFLMSGITPFKLNQENFYRTGARDLHGADSFYEGDSANVSMVLDSLLKGYDQRLRPNYKGPPVEVGITMYISSVSSISEVDMDFTLDFYFRQYWHDPRLAFHHLHDEELCISNEMLQQIWWPDTFFATAKDANFHIATTKNAFLRIKPNGDVLQSIRLTVTSMCSMDLTFFPMDSQVCSLEIESYGFSTKDITYKWRSGFNESVGIDSDVQLPQFKIIGHRLTSRVVELTTGDYSRLACQLYFSRSMGYYIIQIYVPSALIVMLSWLSFWLSREAVPARVALGITTVLTMTTLISSTNAALPKISYLKSIDVYLVTCFVTVFASLLEYAAVSYIGNRAKRQRMLHQNLLASLSNGNGSTLENTYAANGINVSQKPTSSQCGLPYIEQNQKLPTEVRLSSMRRLHTECDLRTLSSNNPYLQHAPFPYLRHCGQQHDHHDNHTNNNQHTQHNHQHNHPQNIPSSHTTSTQPHRSRTDSVLDDWTCETIQCCQRPSIIDKYSRIFFPLSFFCFNIMYWVTYINISKEIHQDFILIEE